MLFYCFIGFFLYFWREGVVLKVGYFVEIINFLIELWFKFFRILDSCRYVCYICYLEF